MAGMVGACDCDGSHAGRAGFGAGLAARGSVIGSRSVEGERSPSFSRRNEKMGSVGSALVDFGTSRNVMGGALVRKSLEPGMLAGGRALGGCEPVDLAP